MRKKISNIKLIAAIKKLPVDINSIKKSTRKEKKFMLRNNNGKLIHFGGKGYKDYLDHYDKDKRERFHARFKENKGYNDPDSGLYWSQKLLW